jgi:hypothetical protein
VSSVEATYRILVTPGNELTAASSATIRSLDPGIGRTDGTGAEMTSQMRVDSPTSSRGRVCRICSSSERIWFRALWKTTLSDRRTGSSKSGVEG